MTTTTGDQTLNCLQQAFDGESNARAKYLSFAAKADAEGYGYAASLFRAAAEAEKIHAANHAKVIMQLGGKAEAVIHPAEVKTTRENLPVAVAGETYEFKEMYPGFIQTAKAEGQKAAVRSFTFALKAEEEHARLYAAALQNLDAKAPAVTWHVCPECGWTTTTLPGKCPVCGAMGERFTKVQ